MRVLALLFLSFHLTVASVATLPGRVVRITDGDTIVILAEGNVQHKIRLQGIDAPERGQVRIPAQSERPFWFNVNTCSGRT